MVQDKNNAPTNADTACVCISCGREVEPWEIVGRCCLRCDDRHGDAIVEIKTMLGW